MANNPETFPELVREVRRQLEISQEELAHKLGVSFATINRWENGKTTPFKLARGQFDAFCKKMADKYLYNRIENYSIIYNGVDIKHFRPMPELRNKKFTILVQYDEKEGSTALKLRMKHYQRFLAYSCSETDKRKIMGNLSKKIFLEVKAKLHNH